MSSFYCFKESRRTEAFIESPAEVKVFSDRLGGCHVAADQFFSSSKVKLIDWLDLDHKHLEMKRMYLRDIKSLLLWELLSLENNKPLSLSQYWLICLLPNTLSRTFSCSMDRTHNKRRYKIRVMRWMTHAIFRHLYTRHFSILSYRLYLA